MRKVIFECIGNVIMIILFARAFLNPFSSVLTNDVNGWEVNLSIHIGVLVIYMIVFGIVKFVGKKKHFLKSSEFDFDDEREKVIVANASKMTYQVTIGLLIVSMCVLAFVKGFFSMEMVRVDLIEAGINPNVDIYRLSIMMFAGVICAAFMTYCVKWCIEHRK